MENQREILKHTVILLLSCLGKHNWIFFSLKFADLCFVGAADCRALTGSDGWCQAAPPSLPHSSQPDRSRPVYLPATSSIQQTNNNNNNNSTSVQRFHIKPSKSPEKADWEGSMEADWPGANWFQVWAAGFGGLGGWGGETEWSQA